MKLSLREWRKENRYSQTAIANLLSKKLNQPVSQDYISRLENGQPILEYIARALQKISKNQIDFNKGE